MTDARTPASALPDTVETILFDAGGVLIDLDLAYVRRLIDARRVEVSMDALVLAEADARLEIHRMVARGGRVGDAWRDYFRLIFGHVGVATEDSEEMIDSLWEAHQRFGLWTVAVPDGPEMVRGLKSKGYRIGVVSNAEGRVRQDLEGAGYDGLLETVVDSHEVGVEKPDPAIFAIALERLDVRAETTIFVGDLPSVDVAGARAAGIFAVLMDPHDHHPDCDAPRLGSLSELAEMLGHPASGAD